MRPTDILKNEHKLILRMLEGLDAMADRFEAEKALDGEAKEAVRFLQEFADKLHHMKEEEGLFVAMEAAGFPRQAGPVGVMLYEHEQGRALVRAMATAIDAGGFVDFANAARSFALLLRGHIEKENQILFNMADGVLSPAKEAELLAEFEARNGRPENVALCAESLAFVERLEARYALAVAGVRG